MPFRLFLTSIVFLFVSNIYAMEFTGNASGSLIKISMPTIHASPDSLSLADVVGKLAQDQVFNFIEDTDCVYLLFRSMKFPIEMRLVRMCNYQCVGLYCEKFLCFRMV